MRIPGYSSIRFDVLAKKELRALISHFFMSAQHKIKLLFWHNKAELWGDDGNWWPLAAIAPRNTKSREKIDTWEYGPTACHDTVLHHGYISQKSLKPYFA